MAEGAGEISALIDAAMEASGGDCDIVQDGVWLRVAMNRLDPTRRAGWKIHLSAVPHSYEELLARALPVIRDAEVPFKCAASVDIVESLNSGEYGLSQVGKAVTVYVGAPEQVAPLGARLGEVLKGLPGPRIIHDCSLSKEAPVYARFGPWDGVFRVDATGRSRRLLLHPELGEIIDPTDGGIVAYPAAPGVPAYEEYDHLAFLRDRFIIVRLLHLSAKGGVFLAVDRTIPEAGIQLLKTARSWTNSDSLGRDARWGLRREHMWLKRLAGLHGVPPAGFILEDSEATALCRPYIEGDTFWELWTRPDARTEPGQACLRQVIKTLEEQVRALHQAGCIVRDLSPGNILVHDAAVWILDFELAEEASSVVAPYRRGTKGFYSEDRDRFAPAVSEDDVYALERLQAMISGLPPQLRFANKNKQEAVNKEHNSFKKDLNADGTGCARASDYESLVASLQKYYQTVVVPKGSAVDTYTLYDGLAGYYVFWKECSDNNGDVAANLGPKNDANLWQQVLDQLPHLPGAYFGAAGVALAMIFQDDQDDDAIPRMGREVLLQLSSAMSPIPDLCQGVAGLGLAAWSAREVLPRREVETVLTRTGAQLERLCVEDEDGIWWPWPVGTEYGGFSGLAYLGFAHGIAGILWLASVVKSDLNIDLLPPKMVEQGFATLLRHGRSLPDGGLWWPVSRDDETCWNAWCHGTPGVVKALATGYTLGMVEGESLRGALLGMGAANSGELCLCHGLASRVDAYADAFAALPELRAVPEIGAAADADRQWLGRAFQEGLKGTPVTAPEKGLMTGQVGIARTLIRFDFGCDRLYRKLLP